MDPRRLLSAVALTLGLCGCALAGGASVEMVATAATPQSPEPASAPAPTRIEIPRDVAEPWPDAGPALPSIETEAERTAPSGRSKARPSLAEAPSRRDAAPRPVAPANGRSAIAMANREARAPSSADAFVGGVQIFAWDAGRVYEVWTAPLRVTALTLALGETVTAKAAGDTVRWQIGESVSGSGAAVRTHVLIKPLQSGLETNLILTTSQRVYLLSLRSGTAEAFNAAIAWDYGGAVGERAPPTPASSPSEPGLVDVAAVTPQGPLDARYRIEARGRSPRWSPTAVFNDGVRTFIALSPEVSVDEAPALFVLAGGEAQLVNYRQVDGLLIVDRVFDEAELRLGDRRPQIVRIRRQPGAVR